MYRVDIFLETDTWYLGTRERKVGYFMFCRLSNGSDYDDLKTMTVKGTYNHCLLTALNAALSRMAKSSEIHIHSANCYILDMMENNLPGWQENGFRTKKGDAIKDQKIWQELSGLIRDHIIIPERGLHEYSHWMKWMLSHDEGEKVDNLVEKPEKPHEY